MKHPSPEDWIPYLDHSVAPENRRALSAHLKDCPECAARVTAWRRAIHALERLDSPARPALAASGGFRPAPWWSLAAALVLALGFVLGQFAARRSAPLHPAELALIRSQLRVEMRAEQRLAREAVLRDLQSARGEDRRLVIAMFDALQRQRLGDYVSLRRDLETLASTADADLNLTRRQLNLLEVAATQSDGKP